MRRLILVCATLALCLSPLAAQPAAAATFSTTVVKAGFSNPVFLTNARDSRLFVVERGGLIKIIHDDKSVTTFLDISSNVLDNGEQGLLGLAFHPNYATNGLFYVYYTAS